MRIIYGVSSEGYGHSSHALAICSHLEKNGHKVLILTYSNAYEILSKKFKTIKVHGLKVIYDEGVMNYFKTFKYNLKEFKKNLGIRKKLLKQISSFNPDLFITDLEPLSSHLSYYYKCPLISICNQNRFILYPIK